MADKTWPFEAGDRNFAPESFDEAVEFNVELTTARSGRVTTLSLPGARFRCTMQFPDTTVAYLVERRQLLGFLASLRGGADRLLLWNLQTPEPLGAMRGSPVLAALVASGASTAALSLATAGANLLRPVDQMQTFLTTGWIFANATLTTGAIEDPNGGMTGMLLNRTATGNHYGVVTATVAATALKTCTAVVWLKAGTLTGNVVLRLRDGAGTEIANVTVTPTSTWAAYWVSGTFGGASAANVQVYVDPVIDVGSAGENLGVWFVDVRMAQGFDILCTSWMAYANPPSGLLGYADEVRRLSTSNAFTSWGYITTAHANRTFTFSVWLKSGTFTGNVTLYLRDGGGATVASLTVTPTAAWTRYSITGTFGATPAANVIVIVDPADGGSIGETYQRYGVQLEPGAVATDYKPYATLLTGDFVAFGGQRVMLTEDATVNDAGDAQITFQPAHRTGAAAASAVTVVRPTAKYVVAQPVVQMPSRGDKLPGFAVELVEE